MWSSNYTRIYGYVGDGCYICAACGAEEELDLKPNDFGIIRGSDLVLFGPEGAVCDRCFEYFVEPYEEE